MKKLTFLMTFLLLLTVQSVNAETTNYIFEFEIVENTGYDLENGVKIDEPFYSQTSKMILPQNDGNVLNLGLSPDYHHLIWFDYYGKVIGYCNGNETTLETGYFIEDCGGNITPPEEAYSFIIQNYNYTGAVDPLEGFYTAYYTANDLIFLTPQTVITLEVTEPLDVNNYIDTFLDSLGLNSEGGKIGLSISIIMLIALLGGIFTKSASIIIGIVTLGFILFSVLGWLPIWITILIIIILAFFTFKQLSGGD